jgi:hypothetical protein
MVTFPIPPSVNTAQFSQLERWYLSPARSTARIRLKDCLIYEAFLSNILRL